jgi:hypothetical protein
MSLCRLSENAGVRRENTEGKNIPAIPVPDFYLPYSHAALSLLNPVNNDI